MSAVAIGDTLLLAARELVGQRRGQARARQEAPPAAEVVENERAGITG